MKKLNRDFTTPAQSKRLLELGVPASSANCYIDKDGKVHCFDGDTPKSLMFDAGCIPCWTTGRLIEIFIKCSPYREITVGSENLIEQLIMALQNTKRDMFLDFSKLEE